MKNKPSWYTNEHDSSWDRMKAAFKNDWEQTKNDFGSDSSRDLKQDVDDTVKQMAGSDDAFENHEQAFRFGHAARQQYGTEYSNWNNDLETRLSKDYGDDWDRDRPYVRKAWEYRSPQSTGSLSDENRPRR